MHEVVLERKTKARLEAVAAEGEGRCVFAYAVESRPSLWEHRRVGTVNTRKATDGNQ